jgi:hypothetical protein
MALWFYDKKLLTGMQLPFRMLPFTMGEDDDLEHLAQEQEERRMMRSTSSFLEASRTQRPRFK